MDMGQHTADTIASILVKAAPPVTVTGAKLVGVSVADWIQWTTLIYVVMMAAHKGWHIYKEWKTGKETSDDS